MQPQPLLGLNAGQACNLSEEAESALWIGVLISDQPGRTVLLVQWS